MRATAFFLCARPLFFVRTFAFCRAAEAANEWQQSLGAR